MAFSNTQSLLDWQVRSFHHAFPTCKVRVVVGYEYEEIVRAYPLDFTHVLNWEKVGPLGSFLEVPFHLARPVVVMYGDTVFYPETIESLSYTEGDVVVGVDSVWRSRFEGRSQADMDQAEVLKVPQLGDVEYTGLVKFSERAMRFIAEHRKGALGTNFLELISHLGSAGLHVHYYDVRGRWAEMNGQNDLVHFILGTKAETLQRIQPRVRRSVISDQYLCIWKNWQQNQKKELEIIFQTFGDRALIVRSSSSAEDGWDTANAGSFKSVLDLNGCDLVSISRAIDDVFESYDSCSSHAQVLIQPFLKDTLLSGVVFTCDLVTGAPYYILNYDDHSGDTAAITSGQSNDVRTVIIAHAKTETAEHIDSRLIKVIAAAQELEEILGYAKLDIEFAVDTFGHVHVFQLRPITVRHPQEHSHQQALLSSLQEAQKQFRRWQPPEPHMLGAYTLFSNMTDWNPAEIIGTHPHPLAISLYRYLITDRVWARQRAEFGYRDTRPSPLVRSFCGQPYVDCRASFNSFIPQDLPEESAQRLVTAYLNRLKEKPYLHDKVEMDIAFTVWTPDFKQKARTRYQDIRQDDIDLLEVSRKHLTAQAFERLTKDIKPLEKLHTRFESLRSSDRLPINKAYLLIEDCRSYGTLSFAHAARAGFVAILFLKSLVAQRILTKDRVLAFQSSIPTVATEFQRDLARRDISLDILLKCYGHLRPGTYDVHQKAYWEDPAFFRRYNDPSSHTAEAPSLNHTFTLDGAEKKGIQAVLPTTISVDGLLEYMKRSIQLSKSVTLIFTVIWRMP